MDSTIDEKLVKYFYSGRPYKVILERLKIVHQITRSMSWLKRHFRKLGLRRRNQEPPQDILRALIKSILCSEKLRGYRAIWRLLRTKYKIQAKRDTVMHLMRALDPEGVEQRKSRRLKRRLYNCKGPNQIWHIDGYDKLTPYGLSIHGCIDGFSRKVLWLKLSPTNRDPSVISRYYLECVESAGGCPRIVRADCGTENCILAKVHIAFRMDHDDSLSGQKSFLYGPSTANTGLHTEGLFEKDNDIHRHTLGFVFGRLLRKDLHDFVSDWNAHPIRKAPHTYCPHGLPMDIYEMPSLYGTEDQLQPIDPHLWATCMITQSKSTPKLCPTAFKTGARTLLHTKLHISEDDITHTNCRNVYLKLVHYIELSVENGTF